MSRLVLTRAIGEGVQIGPDIRVTLLRRIPDGRVEVAIEAPIEVPIARIVSQDSDAQGGLVRIVE